MSPFADAGDIESGEGRNASSPSASSGQGPGFLTVAGYHLLEFAETLAVTYLAIHWIGKAFQSYQNAGRETAPKEVTDDIMRRLGRDNPDKHELNDYEMQIAACVVDPRNIDSSFADIGGLPDL